MTHMSRLLIGVRHHPATARRWTPGLGESRRFGDKIWESNEQRHSWAQWTIVYNICWLVVITCLTILKNMKINGPFIVDLPSWKWWFSIVMVIYQRLSITIHLVNYYLGWWFVLTILKNMSSSIWRMTSHMLWKKNMFESTNQYTHTHTHTYIYIYIL